MLHVHKVSEYIQIYMFNSYTVLFSVISANKLLFGECFFSGRVLCYYSFIIHFGLILILIQRHLYFVKLSDNVMKSAAQLCSCQLVSQRMFPSAVSNNKAGRENELMTNMILFQCSFTPVGFCQSDIYSRIRCSAAKTKHFACKISECEGKSVPVVRSQSRSRAAFRQM